ncbi:thioesterase II family protein [Actinomadura verrucosospora]|uniref:Erythronolide synthase n=1 Tax=Actinomadura verrucosospora TaxID=46165 RepID=A0A7D3VNI9_ACTVE|nr:thioesterase [Actinomadura verrucosospora]QKG18658.1 erythronolide synthase [Actinomadura verrucosospora]
MNPAPWFLPLREPPDGAPRLYVFPHAGAGSTAAQPLADLLTPRLDVRGLNLPGRQSRLDEPPVTALEPLVSHLARELAVAAEPYAVFGYCGGALLAFLTVRRVHELGGRLPVRLFVGSFAAPDIALLPRRLPTLPSDLFWDEVLDLGGVSPEVAEHAELRPVFEGALRADYRLVGGYVHRPAPPPPVPITVLHGGRDATLSRGELAGWRRQSTAATRVRTLDASHWLVEDAPEELAELLADELDGTGSKVPAGEHGERRRPPPDPTPRQGSGHERPGRDRTAGMGGA